MTNFNPSVEILEDWIRNEIARPRADSTIVRPWWRYAQDCVEWSGITGKYAAGFCKNAKLAGKNINEEFGFDVIKLHFPGIWKHNQVVHGEKNWEQDWETHPNGEQIA